MSTETEVTEVVEVAEVVTNEDDTLVTKDDLECEVGSEPEVENEAVKSLWSDPERVAQLHKQMNLLKKVRIPTQRIPEEVLIEGMAEVLGELGWNDYEKFSNTIKTIINGRPQDLPPFSLKTRDQRTSKMDFWIIRIFINIKSSYVDSTGKSYGKKDVLMSREFCEYLRQYCRDVLRDEVQFWSFTGTYRGKQHLDMSRITQHDLNILKKTGRTNPDELVMFQMKRKCPEVYVGQVGTSNTSPNQ
jgi:hypothetical protein